ARHSLGLDQPLAVQYALWMKSALSLRLGHSIVTGQPVTELIAQRFAVTARVVLLAMALALAAAVPAGLVAAWRRGTATDRSIVLVSVLVMSVPSFWVGLLLILVFGIKLRWLPTVGYAGFVYLVLPVTCLALAQAGGFVRLMRSSAMEVLRSDYVTHAYAKGLSDGAVLLRHVLKNAFTPTLTFAGWLLGALLAGAAVIETVFTLPGLGRLLVFSIYSRDYAVVQGIALFVACIYIGVNFLVDLVYPLLDPRVRL
ncbi:MAG: ABC transporter permease, partial [Acetobacteraceae bacterium]